MGIIDKSLESARLEFFGSKFGPARGLTRAGSKALDFVSEDESYLGFLDISFITNMISLPLP